MHRRIQGINMEAKGYAVAAVWIQIAAGVSGCTGNTGDVAGIGDVSQLMQITPAANRPPSSAFTCIVENASATPPVRTMEPRSTDPRAALTGHTEASRSGSRRVQPFRLTSVFPSEGDVLIASPEKIVVAFNTTIDPSSVTRDTLRLLRGQGHLKLDAALANSEVPAAVAASAENPRVLILTPRDPLWNGAYRLVINADPDHPLTDVYGETLRATGHNHHAIEVSFNVDFDQLSSSIRRSVGPS